MQRHRIIVVAMASLLLLSASGRGGGTTPQGPRAQGTPSAPVAPKAITEKDYARGSFDRSTRIDNPWFPLKPGTQYVYQGQVTEGHRRLAHRVVFTVTDLTKVIDGVRTVVVWDRDYTGGRLVEGELAFFAQDNDGNVWAFGEYPEQYEAGRFAGAPDTWLAGLAGTRPGVHMRADPRPGTSSYLQGVAPSIGFADVATISSTSQTICVPSGCFSRALMIDESDPTDPSARQIKYYASGVGNIKVGFAGTDSLQEGLVLAKVRHLDARAMAELRLGALALDDRAFRVNRLYRHTPHAESSVG